jgi:hypothetical protein
MWKNIVDQGRLQMIMWLERITYLLIYVLTPWSRVLLEEKITGW